MMAGIFATMLIALVLAWRGRDSAAVACLLGCLALSLSLFLYEIYNPVYGFRMPWLQTDYRGPSFAESDGARRI
jgi:hypothetical protein